MRFYVRKPSLEDEPFAVLLGDDIVVNDENPATQQLVQAYEKNWMLNYGGSNT